MFEAILGNEPIKSYLRKALLEERLGSTLLFSGPDGVGKRLFANELAAHLLKAPLSRIEQNNHPDLHIIHPEGKSGLYAIERIRSMIDEGHIAPFEASCKVFLLEDAERMQPASANALLKTLEEPLESVYFILLTSQAKEMLPTILSRCTMLSFQPLAEKEIAQLLESKGHPVRLAKLSNGSAGRAFEEALHPEFEEQRKILFSLLRSNPSFLALSSELEKLEKLIVIDKEENPVASSKRANLLFGDVVMWMRDQHLRKLSPERKDLLFFPEEPECANPLPSLQLVEKTIDEVKSALLRNMKLSICLQRLFFKISV